jgi:hypothetical protein
MKMHRPFKAVYDLAAIWFLCPIFTAVNCACPQEIQVY